MRPVYPTCGPIVKVFHYTRSPRDVPISGYRVQLVLHVQRFRCPNRLCQRKTFVERLPQLVPVYGQRTFRLTSTLRAVAFELSAEVGRRVTQSLHMAISGDTLLRILRQTPLETGPTPRVLGIAMIGP
jgi:hypothetical protein